MWDPLQGKAGFANRVADLIRRVLNEE